MNMDYSKAFELLSQDVELMQRNKKAEKAVHDNLYNKGFRDGLAVLDKLRAEIDKIYKREGNSVDCLNALDELKWVIDKYKAESEVEE